MKEYHAERRAAYSRRSNSRGELTHHAHPHCRPPSELLVGQHPESPTVTEVTPQHEHPRQGNAPYNAIGEMHRVPHFGIKLPVEEPHYDTKPYDYRDQHPPKA